MVLIPQFWETTIWQREIMGYLDQAIGYPYLPSNALQGPLITVPGFHPGCIRFCSMHTLNLGILFTANGGSLNLALYAGVAFNVVSLVHVGVQMNLFGEICLYPPIHVLFPLILETGPKWDRVRAVIDSFSWTSRCFKTRAPSTEDASERPFIFWAWTLGKTTGYCLQELSCLLQAAQNNTFSASLYAEMWFLVTNASLL